MTETKKLIAIREKIKKMLVLDRKEKKLCELAFKICKKLKTKNLRTIKKVEYSLKAKPNQQLKMKLEKLKADGETIKALITSFSNFSTSINSEVGWLTNEAGSLTKPEVVKKATAEEAACIKKQESIISEIKKQIKRLD